MDSTSVLPGMNSVQLSQILHICRWHFLTPLRKMSQKFLIKSLERKRLFTFHAIHAEVFRSLHTFGRWRMELRIKIRLNYSFRIGYRSMRMVRSNILFNA